MEKAIFFIGLGISFIIIPTIALIFCPIFNHRPTKIECLYIGIHCWGGLASIMAGIFFIRKFI